MKLGGYQFVRAYLWSEGGAQWLYKRLGMAEAV
jgi:hypothetical protein